MNMHRSCFTAALIVAAGLSTAPVYSAQAVDPLVGTAVPGVCMLSREAVFAQAKIGQAASQRLSQLAAQARSQLDAQGKPLQAEVQSFRQKAASLSETQRNQQGEALQMRSQALQEQADELDERIKLTRAKAMQTIGQDAQPIAADAYKSHHCGLLLNRDAVLSGNMTNDLTGEVIEGLDRKVSTIDFNLEPLPSKTAAKP
ncbi:OmpH family outer membrane protein [Rhodanobacter sp. C03]|uniref:OmpH family outer membrane protein n=1 Tax=Rhodanobacter sp. C03 TaxID=1945858 RepID=UPI0009864105|nr:OmpH family outer membrane protein [Rhodanobacter sp. C03]OOG55437.1 molecular chaperone Skp [Rhodanobacter sp. C03]